jgi:hypothetical protein
MELTEREAQALEDLRKAEELEVTLAEYCRSFELDVKDLYLAKQSLGKKGLLAEKADSAEEAQLSDFVEVQVKPSLPRAAGPVCRIQHRSGLLIECMTWPPARHFSSIICA